MGRKPLSPERKRGCEKFGSKVEFLDRDILCLIFSFLDIFDLVRCSVVCKYWYAVIGRSDLLKVQYRKLRRGSLGSLNEASSSNQSMELDIQKLVMKHHTFSLQEGRIDIDQWRGHSAGVDQCRMRMGLLLTGVGDKVMRLWSLDGYRCVEEYSTPAPLVDFDFDESKIVGLVGTRISIWRRNGKRSIFPSREGSFPRGLCMRYVDPEAVIGCEDGRTRVFDMYSQTCSRIIRMHAGPVTCLSLSDDNFIISGSSLGSVTICGLLSDQRVASLKSSDCTGIKALCYNPCSHLVFAGTAAGYTYCWDLRTMRPLWENRVSPNTIYSLQHMRNDASILMVGGIDGVLRVLDQGTGMVLSRCVINEDTVPHSSGSADRMIERKKGRRLPSEAIQVDKIPRSARPPITCLAVGMKKVVTTHNSNYIRMWKFSL